LIPVFPGTLAQPCSYKYCNRNNNTIQYGEILEILSAFKLGAILAQQYVSVDFCQMFSFQFSALTEAGLHHEVNG